jgi:arylsulfatase A-like enzyme
MPSISRRHFLKQAGVLAAAGVVSMAPSPAPAQPSALPEHPNLLILITDQERYPQYWPADWANYDKLPARKALAQNGLTFTNAFCNSAMCSPSRGTLFTGLYAPQHGVTHTLTYGGSLSPTEKPLPRNLTNLATILTTAGYHVALKGKWHLSKDKDGNPPTAGDVAAYGFQDWEATTAGEANDPVDYGGGCADLDHVTLDQAIAFLDRADLPQPFCLIVGLANPHDALAYPAGFKQESVCTKAYRNTADFNQGITLPPTLTSDDLSTKPDCQKQSMDLYALLGTFSSEQERLNYVNFYAYLHKFVDDQIQTLYNKLVSREINGTSLLQSTIVVRTADHGEMGLSHGGLRQKMFEAYEEAIHIPLVISNPNLFSGPKTNDSWVSLVDLLPTLVSLAGVTRKYPLSGTDLSPIVANPDSSPTYRDVLYTFDDDQAGLKNGLPGIATIDQPNHIRCIRHKDAGGVWKYARYFDPSGVEADQTEMYHLYNADGSPDDIREENNIANPLVTGYNAAKKAELAQCLAQVEAERLHSPFTYLPQVTR